jgi:S-adenosylhomocysteine hydrolase
MTDALIKLGLRADDIYWVDIPYTSHKIVRDALEVLGIPPQNFRSSIDYRLLDPYGPYQQRRAIEIYQEMLSAENRKLLVLDDGAYFLEAASCFEELPRNCCIVEQTSRGFKKISKNAAMASVLRQIPLVNVAQSIAKSQLESPFIGAAVCASLFHHIKDRLCVSTTAPRCLVLGYGHIGKAVTGFLKTQFGFTRDQTFVCDPRLTSDPPKNGFQTWDRSLGGTFDLVIGCSGTTSFDVGDYVFLNDKAILVSASSGAVEFNRRNIVEWAALCETDNVSIDGNIDQSNFHADIQIRFPGRRATLLNGGFPINFDGRICCVPDRYIQITMALMVQAAVQAVHADKPSIYDLDTGVSIELVNEYYTQTEPAWDWLPIKKSVISEIQHKETEP